MIEWGNKYNAFNGMKALTHVKYWDSINKGIIPPPLMVSVDCCNRCNFNCPHCNAKETLGAREVMSIETMDVVIRTLSEWGTKAVCVGGGGESTLNENLPYLFRGFKNNDVEIGLVTNGRNLTYLKNCVHLCKWIGISVDASSEKVFAKMKGVEGQYDIVIDNIRKLIAMKKDNIPEVTYKYLLHPDNIYDVYNAVKNAKELGCDVIHIRPGGFAWFQSQNDNKFVFNETDIQEISKSIDNAREDFEDKFFKVFATTYKFSDDWKPRKTFKKCYAGMTSCVVYPDGTVGLCCDRRGDKGIELGNIKDMNVLWGSDKHKKIMEDIDVSKCPRCTYTHINEIFENVVLEDKMGCYFI